MLLSAKALLDEKPKPSLEEVKKAISGNLCRCTGYGSIVRAIQEASEKMRSEKEETGND
jgi:carbon-monoxide dehydrogenase small subunit